MIAIFIQPRLTDPPTMSALAAASAWVSDLLFGPLATSIAIIAIAWIGFGMLSGRIEIRRGLAVVFGCFLLFGARGIADALRSAAANQAGSSVAAGPPPPAYPTTVQPTHGTNAFDPYAGAAVLRSEQTSIP